jgi:hypothetical protein|tara:strand:+ start:325 stop:525 length:201 start_codon:yes stop_codon:yes gene_type:complete
MAAQVASLEPAATQVLDTVDHLGVAASMSAQTVSEPTAAQRHFLELLQAPLEVAQKLKNTLLSPRK